MIEQILNRKFVLEQLEDVRRYLEEDVSEGRRRGAPLPEAGAALTDEDYETALEDVREAERREEAKSSGQPSFEAPPAERRGEEPADIDDLSFFSRDPVISNLQSALEEYFETREEEQIAEAEPDDRRRGDAEEEVVVTNRSLQGLEWQREPDGRRLFERFSVTDVGWVSCLVAMGITKFRKKHAFNPNPATPWLLADRARILLVGDWGSGLPRAVKVANEMRRVLDEGAAAQLEQHVIHLGDVYYSGWEREYEKRFLAPWPVQPEEAGTIGSWSVNSNHDMYSGGHAYFEKLLEDARFWGHERSSFFSLANRHWKILGLDTAWEEGKLMDPQAGWVREEVDEATRSGRKVMLLSHHQLFSAYEDQSVKLEEDLGDLLATPRIRSWFWGHEHRCMLYKPYKNIEFARCVGHGGVPVYMWHEAGDELPEPGAYEYRARIRKGLEPWALFGFAVLDFDGPEIQVCYIDENGDRHKCETIA